MSSSVTNPASLASASAVDRARDHGVLGRLVATRAELASLLLRWTVAIVIFPHGAQKLLGWFGGNGWSATMSNFTAQMGLPGVIAALVILIEFFAPIALVLGVGVRLAALLVAAVMAGAVLTVHLQHGFFMNWMGGQGGEGFEYHIAVFGACLALMVAGAGRASVDRTATERLAERPT
jgi:putative oxidoreductase